MEDLFDSFASVRKASFALASSSIAERRRALKAISEILKREEEAIFSENRKDVEKSCRCYFH